VDTTGPNHGTEAIGYERLRQDLAAQVKLMRGRR